MSNSCTSVKSLCYPILPEVSLVLTCVKRSHNTKLTAVDGSVMSFQLSFETSWKHMNVYEGWTGHLFDSGLTSNSFHVEKTYCYGWRKGLEVTRNMEKLARATCLLVQYQELENTAKNNNLLRKNGVMLVYLFWWISGGRVQFIVAFTVYFNCFSEQRFLFWSQREFFSVWWFALQTLHCKRGTKLQLNILLSPFLLWAFALPVNCETRMLVLLHVFWILSQHWGNIV